MKYSLDISSFLKEISSLSHSIVFLYFFALFTLEGSRISPCILWSSAFSWVYRALSPLPFTSLPFSAICKVSSDNHFVFLHFFFFLMVLVSHWKDWCWGWNSNTLATWCEELTHWKRPRCWKRLKVGEGGDRGWDGWMASPTQWTYSE